MNLSSATSYVQSAGNTVSWTSGDIRGLYTGSGADTLTGDSTANILSGGSGNDTLSGGNGDDSLYGGAGNDSLVGGSGADTYYWDPLNNGTDTINDTNADVNVVNVNSVVNISGDIIDLNSKTSYTFGGGTMSWSSGVIRGWSGTNGGDTLTGLSTSASYLDGYLGNDSITGGSGNDTLIGGAGNDALTGGSGNDLYRFSAGDGQDIINDSGDTDKVAFDSSVIQSVVAIFQTSSGDLQIGYTNSSGDRVTIQGQTGSGTAIERFELSNGLYMTDADINQIVADMTAYASNNSISLTSLNDVKNDSNLMAIVNGGWHS